MCPVLVHYDVLAMPAGPVSIKDPLKDSSICLRIGLSLSKPTDSVRVPERREVWADATPSINMRSSKTLAAEGSQDHCGKRFYQKPKENVQS